MAHLSVHVLDKTFLANGDNVEKCASRMRELRLRSLQTDPSSFSSKHESEAAQPLSFWLNRLKEPTAQHIFVVRSPSPLAIPATDGLLRDDVEWVGFNVCVEIRNAETKVAKQEQEEAGGGDWYLAAVYIDKSARGSGAGKMMVQFGIDLMRELDREQGRTASVCVTNVLHGNDNALSLYLKLGFEVTSSDAITENKGEQHHTTALKLVL